MRIKAPFVDLNNHLDSLERETQLLYNETVTIVEIQGSRALIIAEEQQRFYKDEGFSGYKGWVDTNALSSYDSDVKKEVIVISKRAPVTLEETGDTIPLPFGCSFTCLGEEEHFLHIETADGKAGKIHRNDVVRRGETSPSPNITELSRIFLGDPYLWGGRTPFCKKDAVGTSGIDCSGLTSILYRILGVDIPRNACDQYRIAKEKPGNRLQSGDLLFSAPITNPGKIDHVMLYVGDEKIIEARKSTGSVGEIGCEERFGCHLSDLESGDETGDLVLYFGSIPF